MEFAVKCSSHYPGYEIAHAPSVELLKSQFDSWRTCKVDASAFVQIPDDFNLNAEMKEDDPKLEIKKKLQGWTKEFTDKH